VVSRVVSKGSSLTANVVKRRSHGGEDRTASSLEGTTHGSVLDNLSVLATGKKAADGRSVHRKGVELDDSRDTTLVRENLTEHAVETSNSLLKTSVVHSDLANTETDRVKEDIKNQIGAGFDLFLSHGKLTVLSEDIRRINIGEEHCGRTLGMGHKVELVSLSEISLVNIDELLALDKIDHVARSVLVDLEILGHTLDDALQSLVRSTESCGLTVGINNTSGVRVNVYRLEIDTMGIHQMMRKRRIQAQQRIMNSLLQYGLTIHKVRNFNFRSELGGHQSTNILHNTQVESICRNIAQVHLVLQGLALGLSFVVQPDGTRNVDGRVTHAVISVLDIDNGTSLQSLANQKHVGTVGLSEILGTLKVVILSKVNSTRTSSHGGSEHLLVGNELNGGLTDKRIDRATIIRHVCNQLLESSSSHIVGRIVLADAVVANDIHNSVSEQFRTTVNNTNDKIIVKGGDSVILFYLSDSIGKHLKTAKHLHVARAVNVGQINISLRVTGHGLMEERHNTEESGIHLVVSGILRQALRKVGGNINHRSISVNDGHISALVQKILLLGNDSHANRVVGLLSANLKGLLEIGKLLTDVGTLHGGRDVRLLVGSLRTSLGDLGFLLGCQDLAGSIRASPRMQRVSHLLDSLLISG
jgi:hypothetical protein